MFDRIAEAAADITEARAATVLREDGDASVVLGAWTAPGMPIRAVGERMAVPSDDLPGCASSPIRIEGGLWGHLTIASGGPDVPEGAADRLERFAAITALAVTSAEARRSLAHLAAPTR